MRLRPLAAAFLLLLSTAGLANDSAVETAAGGLTLKEERRVKMVRERLFISPSLVRVDYVFRNTTAETVTSEVGFPIPTQRWEGDDPGGPRNFADFRAWVNESPAPASSEVRAFADGHEVTDALRRAGLSIEEFGKFDPFSSQPSRADQIQKLPKSVKESLARVGALAPPPKSDPALLWSPRWEVKVLHHWLQSFPPGKDVRIHHEYKPVAGFASTRAGKLAAEHPGACVDEKTQSEVEKRVAAMPPQENGYFRTRWVKYILTTADTWQTPIVDFELTVEKPKGTLVSFCWDGEVGRSGGERLIARRKDFVPSKELEVLFLTFGAER